MQINKEDTTGNGCYSFTGLEDGTYKVKVRRREGGGRQSRIMQITNEENRNDVNFKCKNKRRQK